MELDKLIMGHVEASTSKVLTDRFDLPQYRINVAYALTRWLTNDARKKPVPDLPAKIGNMQVMVKHLVQGMTVEFKSGKPVIKVSGLGEQVLKMFQYGTDWFDPCPRLVEVILTGLFDDSTPIT